MKFDFSKSNNSDFRNKLQSSEFNIMNKNILYITHEVDKILKIVALIKNNAELQKQVDQYFEDDPKDIPEVENDSNTSGN